MGKQRDLFVSFCFSSNFYSKKKWCQRNSSSSLVYWKRDLPVSLNNNFLADKMENASSEDLSSLSAMTQHWRKSDPSPPLKSSSRIIKVFAIFLKFFSPILWFSSLHTCLFFWPLLLSFDHYPQTNLFEDSYIRVCLLKRIPFPLTACLQSFPT